MVHLGIRRYSVIFPLSINLAVCIISEWYCYVIAKDPMAVGAYIIFANVGLIIYFAFREGIRGGIIATTISILYYFYIIYTRHYTKQQFSVGVETIIVLILLYSLLAFIIGWLKEQIDKLIEVQAEERKRLETILQQLPVGAIITDNTGSVTHINKQVDRLLGFRLPIGFNLGSAVVQKITSKEKTELPASTHLFADYTQGKVITGRELVFAHSDGKKVYVQINSTPIRNAKKKIIAVATTISDISQQKEIERQKDDFLSMASHELKTPITSLKMFVELLQKQLSIKNLDKASYFNARIRDQANRLKELTNDLLDVSRIQTGKLHFSFEQFDLSEIIQDTAEGLQATTNQHEIVIRGTKKQIVNGDRYRIYQVLVNLISNAIKYSPQDKKIVIRIIRDNTIAVVSVQDFGIGIEKEQQKKIFDKLYQVNDPEERTFPGLGLGLFISKEIINRHKGRIWVESIKGKGSTFYFSLPISQM